MRRNRKQIEQLTNQLVVLLKDKWVGKEINFIHKGKVTTEKVKSANLDEKGLYFTTKITETKYDPCTRFDVPVQIYESELIEL